MVVVVRAMGDTTDDPRRAGDGGLQGLPAASREMDQLLATGEQVTIALMAMALHA